MNPAILTKISLFAGLSENDLSIIAAHATTRFFPKNAIILNEGDQTYSLYVILSGRVKVYSSDQEGKEIVLKQIGPYEYFGELSLIDDEPRSASVMAVEDSKLGIFSKSDFREYLTQYPPIAMNLLRMLSSKLRHETDSVKSLALMDVYGRVAKVLLQLATEQEGRLITERITYREIANRVGASREMVGRILKDLKQGGYITVDDGRIVINEQLPSRW